MKKYKIISLVLAVVLLLSGCNTNQTAGNNTEDTTKNSQIESGNAENSDDTEKNPTTSEKPKDSEEETTENNGTENDNTENTGTEDDDTENDNSEEIQEKEHTLYAQTNVNVRSLPSTDGEKLGTLSTNQEITALGDAENGWQKVRYHGQTAYVSAKYLGTEKVVVVEKEPVKPSGQVDEITAEDIPLPDDFDPNGIVIVIDAGHQGKGNYNKEPDGPGSSTMKAKVSSGTQGCATRIPEYQLTLEVSLKLRDELKARGYQVVMIRENHAINISNSERAKVANNLNADAFIRIHADGSEDSSKQGAMTICQTKKNPYNAEWYEASYKLSKCVLDEFIESTGAKKRKIWQTDTMSGINWCEVPVTILEMGYMSNPEEDRLMNSDEYQEKMVEGIANGLDEFFGR